MQSRRPLALESLAVGALLSLVAFLAAHPLLSVDFFWHLALGDVIHARGRIPDVDLFSAVHPERPYVQFNWLWDWLAAQVHAGFGLRGIRVAQGLCLTATFALLYGVTRRRLGSAPLTMLVAALCVTLFQDRFRARPDALTLAFAIAILPPLLGGHRGAGWRQWGFVFGLGALWSNIHGGTSLLLVLSMGALLAGTLVARAATSERPALRPVVGLMLAAIAGIACSPTLIPGLVHWLRAVQPQMAMGNQEWDPSYTMLRNGISPTTLIVGLGPTAVAIAYGTEQVRRVRRGGVPWADVGEWLLCGGYLVLAHHAVRNAFLCFVPVLCMLVRYAGAVPVATPARRRLDFAAAALAALMLASNLHYNLDGYGGVDRVRRIYPHDLLPGTFPVHAADFMVEAEIEGPVNDDGRWGGYLIHRLWPRSGVFIDTRHNITAEMWPVMQASQDPIERPRGLQRGFSRYGLELSVHRAPTFPLVRPERGWVLLYKAGDQEVYQHVDGPHARSNIARAGRWLAGRGGQGAGSAPGDPVYADAVARQGAAAYLADVLPQERAASAAMLIRQQVPVARARGHRVRARLRFDVGDYAGALADYETAMSILPAEPRAPLLGALSAFALGRDARAREFFQAFRARQERGQAQGLQPLDRARAILLQGRLAGAGAR